MHQLKHTTEPEPEEECTGDREERRAEVVPAVLAEHAMDEGRSGGVEVEVVYKLAGKCVWMGVQIGLDNEQRGQHREEHVQGEKSRLQRPFHRLVATPDPNGYPTA